MLYRKKYARLALFTLIFVSMMSGFCLAATESEEVLAGVLLASETVDEQCSLPEAAVIMNMKVDTTMYSKMFRDYFWVRNEADTITYTCTADGIPGEGKTEALLIDCRFYFPMELIVSRFGEDAAWDGAFRRVFVDRNGQRTYMSTIRIDSVPYVKIRDFECLGYRIEYIGMADEARVNILKP